MTDLRDWGYDQDAQDFDGGLIPARITEVRRERYTAVCAFGEVSAVLKGSFFYEAMARDDFPAIGDFVLLKHGDAGNSTIARVLPRKSKFSRPDFSGHAAGYVKTVLEQVVAANFDYVFILSSLNRDFKVNRVARYLTAAIESGGAPVVVLTKADLCEDPLPYVEAVKELSESAPVVALSSVTGAGLEELNEYLHPGKTIVFLGMSGVGKSSLLNALAGERLMDVNEIREDDSRGRHTTTHRQMFRLSSGALVIDTPGMREIGLWNAEEGIRAAFSDVEDLFAACKFSNCTHTREPGCAVLAALEDGSLSRKQWEGYLFQKKEAAFMDGKSGYLRSKREFQKSIAKGQHASKKRR